MDGLSIAASIVGVAGAGIQISIRLVTLATQISTASERISSIGNDISLTAGVLHQLEDLMTQKTPEDGISIFSKGGLETTKTSAAMCDRIFHEVDKEAKKASEQLRSCKKFEAGKFKLSKVEQAKWPFLQPSLDILRADLREAKGTLMLMLQVTSLALSKKMADISQSTSANMNEQRDFVRAIIALQQQGDKEKTIDNDQPPSQSKSECISGPIPSKSEEEPRIVSNLPSVDIPLRLRPRSRIPNPDDPDVTMPSRESDTNSSRNMDIAGKSDVSIHNITMPRFPAINTSVSWPGRPDELSSSENEVSVTKNVKLGSVNVDKELHLLLIKPLIKDYFDRIELTWTIYNAKMQQQAMKTYMNDLEKNCLHSVKDVATNLYAYEQSSIDAELQNPGYEAGASLVALKRTKVDMTHRDITLKDVPGLQFVVERTPLLPQRSRVPELLLKGKQSMAYLPIVNTAEASNKALQDYQMQLMLLEQQNKKGLLMARQEQENMRATSDPDIGPISMPADGHQMPMPNTKDVLLEQSISAGPLDNFDHSEASGYLPKLSPAVAPTYSMSGLPNHSPINQEATSQSGVSALPVSSNEEKDQTLDAANWVISHLRSEEYSEGIPCPLTEASSINFSKQPEEEYVPPTRKAGDDHDMNFDGGIESGEVLENFDFEQYMLNMSDGEFSFGTPGSIANMDAEVETQEKAVEETQTDITRVKTPTDIMRQRRDREARSEPKAEEAEEEEVEGEEAEAEEVLPQQAGVEETQFNFLAEEDHLVQQLLEKYTTLSHAELRLSLAG